MSGVVVHVEVGGDSKRVYSRGNLTGTCRGEWYQKVREGVISAGK